MAKAKPKRDAPPATARAVPSKAPAARSAVDDAAPATTSDAPLLFCPFCRECYEGIAQCPEHDLKLVTWEELPRTEDDGEVHEDDAVSPVDLRFGRGELLAGVVILMASVLCPLFTVTDGEEGRTFSLLEAATDRAPNLWTVPFVAALVLSIVLRRRTIGQMLGARLAMLILATGPFISLGYTLWKIYAGAGDLSAALRRPIEVHLGWGIALVIAGGVLLVVGSLRLGTMPRPTRKGRRADLEEA